LISENFRAECFEGCSNAARAKLSVRLETVVLERIHQLVDREFEIIARELNELGHSLSVREERQPGDIGYIEENGLRLNVDVIISSGYDDLVK